jgi:hypothetical protein
VKDIQVCSNKGSCPLQRGDNHKKLKMGVGSFDNLFLQNHWANFNQTRINHPWGRGFKFLQMKGIALLEGEVIGKSKNTLNIFKNLPLLVTLILNFDLVLKKL